MVVGFIRLRLGVSFEYNVRNIAKIVNDLSGIPVFFYNLSPFLTFNERIALVFVKNCTALGN
jgi:hypothetical protein